MAEELTTHHGLRRPIDADLDVARKKKAAPHWPTFIGRSHLVGTSPGHVSVYVDAALGAEAQQNAKDLLAGADAIVKENNAFFGLNGGAVQVILFALSGATDGTGGADHMACNFTQGQAIEVDVSYGAPERVAALFEAELSECAMNGNLCGLSTGEALSRWCAAAVSNNALADYATAPTWAQDGMVNWVDQTNPTDQDADSTGCGMAFLSWLMSQGHSLSQVAQAMVSRGDAGTFAELYATLTGDASTSAWTKFIAAIDALAGGVTSDDPFNALAAIRAPAMA